MNQIIQYIWAFINIWFVFFGTACALRKNIPAIYIQSIFGMNATLLVLIKIPVAYRIYQTWYNCVIWYCYAINEYSQTSYKLCGPAVRNSLVSVANNIEQNLVIAMYRSYCVNELHWKILSHISRKSTYRSLSRSFTKWSDSIYFNRMMYVMHRYWYSFSLAFRFMWVSIKVKVNNLFCVFDMSSIMSLIYENTENEALPH